MLVRAILVLITPVVVAYTLMQYFELLNPALLRQAQRWISAMSYLWPLAAACTGSTLVFALLCIAIYRLRPQRTSPATNDTTVPEAVSQPRKLTWIEKATLVTSLTTVVALAFTWLTVKATQRQVEVTNQGQLTDRFNKAVDHLGSDKMELRIGGIHALERISLDSEDDRDTIGELLSAFIRNRAAKNPSGTCTVTASADVSIAMSVLYRRNWNSPQLVNLDLKELCLSGLHIRLKNSNYKFEPYEYDTVPLEIDGFRDADLSDTDFSKASLVDVIFSDANLEGANFTGADLADASMHEATVTNATLTGADLRGAYLNETNFTGANLSSAKLMGADLSESNLTNANLRNADLTYADLTGAHLDGADLTGATLLNVTGLNVPAPQTVQPKRNGPH